MESATTELEAAATRIAAAFALGVGLRNAGNKDIEPILQRIWDLVRRKYAATPELLEALSAVEENPASEELQKRLSDALTSSDLILVKQLDDITATITPSEGAEGGEIPDHFGRDEVLAILREYYEGLTEKVEIKLHGAATGDEKK